MEEIHTDQLRRVIEVQHGGVGKFLKSVRVHAGSGKDEMWNGLVHVFDLTDNPKAKRAYAWASGVSGGSNQRYFAVLHMGKVNGPTAAVKAAAMAIHQWGASGSKR